MIDATCEKIDVIEVKIPIRIADKNLPSERITPIFRDADLKSGECLYKNTTSQCINSDVPTASIYNSKGYTSDEWSTAFPKTDSPSRFEYCRYCKEINDSLTSTYNGRYDAYFKVFNGVKYQNCLDKYGQTSNDNRDGCYTFRYEEQEVRTQYPCQFYQCSEQDQIPGEFLINSANVYDCPVFCTDFNHPALWEERVKGYVCKKPIEPDPVEKGCGISKKESWDCLNEEVTHAVNNLNSTSMFDDIYNFLLNYFSNKSEENNNQDNEHENNDNLKLDNVEIKKEHTSFSIYDFAQNIFPTSTNCPVDNSITIMGKNYTFSYSKLCGVLKLLGNLVMIFSIFISYKLIRDA